MALAAGEHETPAAMVGLQETVLGHTGVRSRAQGMAWPQTLRKEATERLQVQMCTSTGIHAAFGHGDLRQHGFCCCPCVDPPLSSLPVHLRDEENDIRTKQGWIHWRQEFKCQ